MVIRYLANDNDDDIDDDENEIEENEERKYPSLNTEQKMHEMIGYDDHSVNSPNGSISSEKKRSQYKQSKTIKTRQNSKSEKKSAKFEIYKDDSKSMNVNTGFEIN